MDHELHKLLKQAAEALASYLDRLLPSLFDNWWKDAVLDKLSFQQQRRVEQKGTVSHSSLDLAALLGVEVSVRIVLNRSRKLSRS